MTSNDQKEMSLRDQYPNLSDHDFSLLIAFPEQERDKLYFFLSNVERDGLSDESLLAVFEMFRIFGSLDSGFITVARSNFDLREKLKREKFFSRMLIIASTIVLAIIGLLIYLFSVYPKFETFQTVDNSVICEIKPEKNPLLTDVAIQEFAKSAVLSVYTFDYINWRNQLNDATSRYFTPDGRAAFNKAIKNSGSLDHIISNNLLMKSTSISAPQIEEKGFDSKGMPYWIVRMPMSTEFYTGNPKPTDVQNFVAQVKVITTKRDAFNPKGLGVYSVILRPYKEQR